MAVTGILYRVEFGSGAKSYGSGGPLLSLSLFRSLSSRTAGREMGDGSCSRLAHPAYTDAESSVLAGAACEE